MPTDPEDLTGAPFDLPERTLAPGSGLDALEGTLAHDTSFGALNPTIAQGPIFEHTPQVSSTTSVTDEIDGDTRFEAVRPADTIDERAAAFAGTFEGGIAPPTSPYVPGQPLVPGTKLGSRYTVLKLLGRGGMGAVYQAYDDELGVAVAIKTILPGTGGDDRTLRDQVSRFKSELLLARQVTHKNVVRIHDLGEVADLKYITMSYVAGETLTALIARLGKVPVPQALALARQIADGMAAAHDVGVVHRDLKPDNVMVTPDGQALIMDFGIASSSQGKSKEGRSIVGTIGYMAPEQARGESVDARADIYAFGLIVYDMLSGRRRADGYSTPVEELRARFDVAPPAIRTVRDEVPAPLEAIVTTATQPLAENRFVDTAALRDAFAALTDTGELRPVVRPRAAWPAVAAGILATALVVTGGWWAITPAAIVEKPPVTVLVADFENRTGDPVFDGVVEQALGLGIESASFVTAYPRRDALRAAATIKAGGSLDESMARLIALREGIDMVLVGAVEPSAGAYRISTRVLQGRTEQATEISALSVDAANRGDVLDAVGRLAGDVREALGDTAVSGDPTASEAFTAASLEAAAAYAKAQELLATGRVEATVAQYQETLRLDPEMGRAYSGLAAQYANLARTAEAETHYQQALARIDRMTDREKLRTRGGYYLFARKPELAAQEFTALVKAYPGDASGLANLALASFYQRDMTQALEQGRRAAAVYPTNLLRRANVALYAMYAGQFEDAITEADAVHQMNPTHLKAFVARALSLLALDRVSEASLSYDQLAATGTTGASFAVAGRADLAHYQGRLSDAAALLTAGIDADVASSNATAAAAKRLALAEVRLEQGDTAAATREADAATAAVESDLIRLSAGLIYATAGGNTRAELLAGALATRLEADPQSYGRLILAELALARKDPRKAVEYGREAQKLSDTWPGRVVLGRAYLALNAFPEAYAEFDAALKRRGEATAWLLDDVPSYRRLAPVHYYLGVAQQGLKSKAASESFKTYLAIKQSGEERGMAIDARRRLAQP